MASGCAMSDMIDADKLVDFKNKHPKAVVVTYVNSSAEVKAESDVICTSSNAVDIVRNLPDEEVIMAPDKNLAYYVESQVKDKKIYAYDGYCPIHHRITAESVRVAKENHPNAMFIAHPECQPEVIELADHTCSTNGMVKAVVKNSAKDEFIVMTECGMVNRLLKEFPDKKFYTLCNMCFDMKKNDLKEILHVLETEQNEIEIDEGVVQKAQKALDRMFELTDV